MWYHEGPPELQVSRVWIANFSLPRYSKQVFDVNDKFKNGLIKPMLSCY